jgi:hypothetical protein
MLMRLEGCEPRALNLKFRSGALNRHAALVALNDRIKVEGSGKAERSRRTKPNKRFDRSGMSLAFIVNLEAARRYFPPGQSRR